MSGVQEQTLPACDETPIHRGQAWIAWLVIIAVAVWLVAQRNEADPQARQKQHHALQSLAADWQARYFIGATKMFEQPQSEALLKAAESDRGTIEQQLRNVVLIGEIRGPQAAVDKLETLQPRWDEKGATDDDRAAADVLRRLYGDLVDKKTELLSIKPVDEETLVRILGFSGRLALHPAGGSDEQEREQLLAEARQTVTRALMIFAALVFAALCGVAALATIVLLLLFRPPSRALPTTTRHGGIYAETFAVWIVLYVALSYSARLLPAGRNPLLLLAAIMLAGLAALAWPVIRGLPWRTVREDIGLHFGRKPLVELLVGPVAYLAALPLTIAGILIVVLLLAITHRLPGGGEMNSDGTPYHPIVSWLLKADGWQKLQIVFLAAVVAPLVEETMFRGVLYRQLRDATRRLGYVGSVLASALVTSFVFAAIHPQGWVAVPALMSLALAFTLAREWRGTLLPAMIAHGINNGLLTCVLISMGSG